MPAALPDLNPNEVERHDPQTAFEQRAAQTIIALWDDIIEAREQLMECRDEIARLKKTNGEAT